MVGDSGTSIEAFYEKHHREAYAWAQSKLKNREDALDAVHDAFIKVMRATQRPQNPPMTPAWLHRIVINVCIDRHRRKRRSCELALDEVTQRHAHALKSAAFEPSAAFEAKEVGAAIGAGLEGLSDQHRAVLVMRELHGMTYEQIARGVDCSAGTVMSRLFHARRYLRRALGELLELSPERVALAA
ncbi:MAG: RNA polymerase sigma factor [Nannocystaceae bacterium]|nr:RNA polymerase sigma factor [Nannocystaceae bacterium]